MIDMHCHIDLFKDYEDLIQEIDKLGIYVLSVTTVPSAFLGTQKIAKNCPRIKTALGMHPEVAHERVDELEIFNHLVPQAKYIGEIGLDGSPGLKNHHKVQGVIFREILAMVASAGGRIISIHSRKAADTVLDCLSETPDAGVFILHWFSGNKRQLQRAIDLGCWFSVGPAMLNSKKGKELATLIPKNRILTETDGPFAKAKNKPLSPLDIGIAQNQLANLWGIPKPEVNAMLLQNLSQLVQSP